MTEIIGFTLVMSGIAMMIGSVAYVVGDFDSIKQVILLSLAVMLIVGVISGGCYLLAGGE